MNNHNIRLEKHDILSPVKEEAFVTEGLFSRALYVVNNNSDIIYGQRDLPTDLTGITIKDYSDMQEIHRAIPGYKIDSIENITARLWQTAMKRLLNRLNNVYTSNQSSIITQKSIKHAHKSRVFISKN